MRYVKPIVMELNSRVADGQQTEACYNGSVANGAGETCYVGEQASYSLAPCWPGISPRDGTYYSDCVGGTGAYYCDGGSAPQAGSDPYGCRVGPSVTV